MAFRSFGAFYARSFEKRPWVTLAVANGTLGAVADGLAQSLEWQKLTMAEDKSSTSASESKSWDVARTSRFVAFGAGMAPLLDKWNRFIEHRFPLRTMTGSQIANAGKVSVTALAKRVAVDQIGFAPFGLVMFVGAMGIMEGRSYESLQNKFSEMYMPALIANWQVWPLIQCINFRFMPLRYRVPFTGLCGIAWQVFLSLLNSSKKTIASAQTDQTPA